MDKYCCKDFKREIEAGIHIEKGIHYKEFYLIGVENQICSHGCHSEKVNLIFHYCPFCGKKLARGKP